MKKEISRWLAKAIDDLDTAKYTFAGKKFDATAFFAQQSVEKALKSMCIKKFEQIEKTHDLVWLANKVGLPENLKDFCKELSPAYLYTRYPDVAEITEIREFSKRVITYAEEVIEWVKKNI